MFAFDWVGRDFALTYVGKFYGTVIDADRQSHQMPDPYLLFFLNTRYRSLIICGQIELPTDYCTALPPIF